MTSGLVRTSRRKMWRGKSGRRPTPARNSSRRRIKPNAVSELSGSIVRIAFASGEPIREAKVIKAGSSGYIAALLPARHAGGRNGDFAGSRRGRFHPSERPCRHHSDAHGESSARKKSFTAETILARCARACDRPDGRGEKRPARDRGQDRDGCTQSARDRNDWRWRAAWERCRSPCAGFATSISQPPRAGTIPSPIARASTSCASAAARRRSNNLDNFTTMDAAAARRNSGPSKSRARAGQYI